MSSVEVCGICDIAGCHHVCERQTASEADTLRRERDAALAEVARVRDDIAKGLWAVYVHVPNWMLKPTDAEKHAAHCAIRCCATRLNVYPQFCAQEAPDDAS